MDDLVDVPVSRLSPAAVAGVMSIAAAAVQMFTAGTLGSHRQAVMTIALVAAGQLGWGIWALLRAGRDGALLGAVLHLTVVSLWLGAATSGLSFITGLEVRRPIDAALVATVVLSGIAGFGAIARLIDGRPLAEQTAPATRLLWVATAIGALVVVATTVSSATARVVVPATAPTAITPTSTTNPGGLIGLPTGGGDIDEELGALVSSSGAASTTTTTPAATTSP